MGRVALWLMLMVGVMNAAAAGAVEQPEAGPVGAAMAGADWKLITSHESVEARLDPPVGALPVGAGSGFTLSYHFSKGSGFVIAQLPFPEPVELPENYELSFSLVGQGPSNDLEVKLLDAGEGPDAKLGESVWWVKRRDVEWPIEPPARIINKAKHFQFAWGPLSGAKIKKLGGIEIVVASSSGGEGAIVVTDLRFRALPAPEPYKGKPRAVASDEADGGPASAAIDDDLGTRWIAKAGKTSPTLTVDFGQLRDFDGVRIDWASPVRAFSVDFSDDGASWRRAWSATTLGVKTSFIDLPDTTTRFARVSIDDSTDGAGIAEVRVLQVPERETLGIWRMIAGGVRPEAFPFYFTGRQSSWTTLGAPTGTEEALINEQGVLELWRAGASLEPVVTDEHGRAAPWTVTAPPTMLETGLPIASVSMANDLYDLTVTAFVDGPADDATLLARYELRSRGAGQRSKDRFHLLVRPFQVNPPWQFLNTVGGTARVRTIEQETGDAGAAVERCDLVFNGRHRLQLPVTAGGGAQLFSFDDGEAGVRLAQPGSFSETSAARGSVNDPRSAASADWSAPLALQPGGAATFVIACPLNKVDRAAVPGRESGRPLTAEQFGDRLAAAVKAWSELVSRASVTLPPGALNDRIGASIRASLAYILINRDGPGFQPGSRSYERSWIRDGSLTGAALLEFGMTDEVKQFIDWYAGYQFSSGGVPCVVDRRGADPVIENDSHGQLIYALAEYYRYTGDEAFVRKHFGAVERAFAHIEAERGKRKTAEYAGDATRAERGKAAVPLKAFYGLMPESISHEGYSAKPMHSYWDDFFTLKGLRDAAYLAGVLKEGERAERFAAAADDMAGCLRASIELAREAHGVEYIPGCVELGDFDATSTTVAVNPCGALKDLPRAWYDATFEKWWRFFEARRDGKAEWVDYTPYEWRIVGSLVMLGQRERAWESVKWYMQDQLPARATGDTPATGWLHWAEIVHKDRGVGKWVGDMPHTWVASDFLRSVRTMFVYEEASPSPERSNLVLFAGVPRAWADAPGGVAVSGLRTPYGPVNASLKKDGEWYELSYSGLERVPFRVRLAPPVAWPPKEIKVLEGGGAANDKEGGVDGVTTGMRVRFR